VKVCRTLTTTQLNIARVSALGAAGQRRMAISGTVVVDDGHDELLKRLKTRGGIHLNASNAPKPRSDQWSVAQL
jgi:hypothetical protein